MNLRFADRGENIAADRYDYDREWKRDDFTVNGQLNASLIMDVLNGDRLADDAGKAYAETLWDEYLWGPATDRYDQCGTCLKEHHPWDDCYPGRLRPTVQDLEGDRR